MDRSSLNPHTNWCISLKLHIIALIKYYKIDTTIQISRPTTEYEPGDAYWFEKPGELREPGAPRVCQQCVCVCGCMHACVCVCVCLRVFICGWPLLVAAHCLFRLGYMVTQTGCTARGVYCTVRHRRRLDERYSGSVRCEPLAKADRRLVVHHSSPGGLAELCACECV